MRFSHVIRTIETHTGGNPTRTVIAGGPRLSGRTMMEKMEAMREQADFVRTVLTFEPRGMSVMSGALLTDPVHPQAHFGVVYFEVGGYLPMCGHDTIGLITALVETGQVVPVEPETIVVLDTPAGLVRAVARVAEGRVEEVRFDNVPAFVLARDVTVPVEGLGPVTLDIAWGGNFYGIVEAGPVGVVLDRDHAARAIDVARRIRSAVDAAIPVVHPEFPGVRGLTHVEFFGPPDSPDADIKNLVIVPPGGVDRSPCGTGTAAKTAVRVARGEMAIGESFRHQSVTGAVFTATALEPVAVGPYSGVRARIGGSARLHGDSTFVVEPGDPLWRGFLLG